MSESVRIRPMTAADVDACARIMAENSLWQRYSVTFESARERLGAAVAGGESIFVAEVAERVAGFVWCVERGAFARSGYIPLIGVAPEATGHGVGGRLMDHAEAFLGRSSPDVFLTVSDFNEAAQRFYRRRGYRQAGALPDYVIPGVTELIFWKRLQSMPQSGIENIT